MVLCYHRVYNPSSDPQLLSVSPEHFEGHLQIISKYFKPQSSSSLIADIRNKTVKSRSVVLTFDDGYFDNYEFALPLLEKYNIPATFFIASAYIDNSKEFYWDELVKLTLDEHSQWNVSQRPSSCDEFKYANITALIKHLPSEYERQKFMDKLYSTEERCNRPEMRRMTVEQIKYLSESDLFEIGSHSCHHLSLSTISKERQSEEIENDLKNLEKMTGKRIRQLCYPYGEHNDATMNICAELNLTGAFAFRAGCVTNKSKLYSIPRFLVPDWDKNMFKRKIKHFYGFFGGSVG